MMTQKIPIRHVKASGKPMWHHVSLKKYFYPFIFRIISKSANLNEIL